MQKKINTSWLNSLVRIHVLNTLVFLALFEERACLSKGAVLLYSQSEPPQVLLFCSIFVGQPYLYLYCRLMEPLAISFFFSM